uniref:FCP1 homology domain-containing protein n=1 Tax=Arcella intermedia TaxID=1963864 RepID=A0A6B2LH45_9EUKA
MFDLDGLLLDTEPLYEEAIGKVLALYGHTYDGNLRSQVIGKGEHEGAGIIVSTKKLPISPAEFLDKRNKFLKELFLKTQPKPGALKLTLHLAKHKIPMALATSSLKLFLRLKFTNYPEWLDEFDFVVTGDDVQRAKPDPQIFIKAAQGLGLPPTSCLCFEDSPSGSEAGYKAGCKVISVPDPAIEKSRYQPWATQILSDLTQFKPEQFGLPPYTQSNL